MIPNETLSPSIVRHMELPSSGNKHTALHEIIHGHTLMQRHTHLRDTHTRSISCQSNYTASESTGAHKNCLTNQFKNAYLVKLLSIFVNVCMRVCVCYSTAGNVNLEGEQRTDTHKYILLIQSI